MKELKNLAKAKGIGNDNNSKLKKNELIDLLYPYSSFTLKIY